MCWFMDLFQNGGQILPVLFVMTWTYLNYIEPLALPAGLLILYGFSTNLTRVF
jgi:hypothetical protein